MTHCPAVQNPNEMAFNCPRGFPSGIVRWKEGRGRAVREKKKGTEGLKGFGVGEDDGGVGARGGRLVICYRFDGVADGDVVVAGSCIEWNDSYGNDGLKWALLRSGGGGLRFWKHEEDDV
ncbi:hypothetical protein LR48_Vigan03g124200 [Vigna angularis]|uniref:Uncharacterized protein n=1 Tax=Phaseolus angularis TaxID=3914 RepID=A0A0L9U4Z1_PHAAN|nr:hypothetical protein LR48_Vigan03g124200 [Vigna angularis]